MNDNKFVPACFIIDSVSKVIKDSLRAKGINFLGGTKPFSGCCHRAKASSPTILCVFRQYWG
jgi:hypothetical protein